MDEHLKKYDFKRASAAAASSKDEDTTLGNRGVDDKDVGRGFGTSPRTVNSKQLSLKCILPSFGMAGLLAPGNYALEVQELRLQIDRVEDLVSISPQDPIFDPIISAPPDPQASTFFADYSRVLWSFSGVQILY